MKLAMFGRAANDTTYGTSGAAELLAAIVNSSFDAIVSTTLDGRVTSWNPAASELFGYHSEEMIGESVRRLIPSDRQDEEDRILARIKAGERIQSYVTVRLDKEQRRIDVSLTVSPIWDQNRKIIGASKIIRTIASQKDGLEALRWRQFVDQVPVPMLMLDRNMVHLACSRRWVEVHGVDAGIGRYHYDLFPQVPEHWKEAHRRGMAGQTVSADEEVFVRPDGGMQWLRWEVRPWLTSDGTIGGITIMTEDVTDRVLAVRALRESELRMRLAQEAAKAGAWEWELGDNSLRCSDSLWSLYGVEKPAGWQASIEAWAAIIHLADRERVIAAVMAAAALGHDYEVPWRLDVPEGEPERWFITRGSPIVGANGSPVRYFGVVIDITEQKLAEDALREREMVMRLAQEAAKAGAWEWRLADNQIQWSDSLWSLYGVPKPERWEPTLEAWRSLVHPADRERITMQVWEAVSLGQDIEVQWRLKLPEGEPERWFLSRGRPLADGKGNLDRYFGVIIDITEQKLMEAALRESKERESFLLSLNDALRSIDEPIEAIAIAAKMLGQKLNANQVVYAKTGETGERASITHEWNDGAASGAFAIDRINDFARSLIEGLKNDQTVAVSDVRLDPRTCNPEAMTIFERGSIAAFITVPFIKNHRLAGGLAVHKRNPHAWKPEELTLAREVAERTWEAVERARVSQALRDSEERLKFALEAGQVGSWEMSLETRIFAASDLALFLFDFPPETQPSYEELIARIHPDDSIAVDKALKRTAETGQPLRIEFRRLHSDGSVGWFDARAERRFVSGRQFMGGLVQDITERVNQKEAAERAAKAKSEFLSNMSHELRTPMHAILGYSEICTTAVREGEGEDIEKYLNNITTAGERLLILLNDLLDLAKMEAGRMEYKFEYVDLREVVEHALMELDPLIKAKKLEMSVRLEEHTTAHFDRAHLIQVLVNLISNAIKFSTPGSQIGIDLAEDRVSSGGRGVRCRVADEGPGIPDDELEAVFDKFVQSKKTKTGKGGTGLGLAICDHIIKAHGGAIWAENARPHGAVFTFVVPKDHDARGHAINVAKSGE